MLLAYQGKNYYGILLNISRNNYINFKIIPGMQVYTAAIDHHFLTN
jgi:hypothetical protein